ncbi:MAG: hypothetical protein BRC41_19300 [Cyanobacteria bacterium QH_9_48_43]|nr:MAG: hypothetical protein BRC41_19300 [Cyanobacteria bacterium QH_9_48_43]
MLKRHEARHKWIGQERYHITPNGDVFPGVTTILSATKPEREKQALENWRKRVGAKEADKVKKDATERGSRMHNQIEEYLTGLIDFDEITEPIAQSVKPILKHIDETWLIEGNIWHPSGFAGSVDFLGVLDGTPTVIDWKTSRKPKKRAWIDDYFCQVAAYSAGMNRVYQEQGVQIKNATVVIAVEGVSEAQIFRVANNELMSYWEWFQERVEEYKKKVAADEVMNSSTMRSIMRRL